MNKISSRDIRTNRMAYHDVMQTVKSIQMLPVLNVATLCMVAEYLETDYANVSNYYNCHKKELEEYGIVKLFPKDFENYGYTVDANCPIRNCSFVIHGDTSVRVTNNGARCMSELAIFNMALGIGKSEIAEKIKAAAALAETESGKVSAKESVDSNVENMVSEPDDEAAATDIAVDILTFTNVEFGTIRLVEVNGQPWFVGKDVADSLGYANSRKALKDHVDIEDKNTVTIRYGTSGNPNQTIINESGMYSLIMSSKLPTAKQFKRWVTSEVLPSVRKNGGYIAGQEELTESELIAKALLASQKIIEERNKKIAELATSNQAMAEKINTWDRKSAINALIRTYAARCMGGDFKNAFSDFYRQFDYKYHTKLKARRADANKKTGSMIDLMSDKEVDDALKLAVAICEGRGINAGAVINEVNLAAASLT